MHGVAVCDIRQAWRASEPGEPRNKLRKPPAPHSRFRARRERPRAKQAPGRLRAGCGRQPDPLRPGVRPSHSRSTSRQAAPPDALPCTPAQTQPRCLRASRPRNAERSRVGQRESSLMVKRPPRSAAGSSRSPILRMPAPFVLWSTRIVAPQRPKLRRSQACRGPPGPARSAQHHPPDQP